MKLISRTWDKKIIAWTTIITFSMQPVLAAAQAIADPNAPAQNRPSVESAQNGVPVVQIATPSAAGVSRNLYQQFNVGSQGLILNNSRVIANTQLAGHITGNPNLTNGSARVILNEVTGTGASYLRGYTEVAGQRAEVIIANPNGIFANGAGFINTSRAVLTTGTPVFGGSGSLEAFRVTGGQIAVEGTGLDASNSDRVDLISRAVSVNAGIWAKELNVVTGANNVNANTLETAKITGDGPQPVVAIDVSDLGGMYANKIKLVGTEQGVGVNSRGTIAASGGDLTLTQEGKIVLAGKTNVAGSIVINSKDAVTNTGTTFANGSAQVTATSIDNSGVLAAAQNLSLIAQTLSSTGTLGAGISSDGSVGKSGDLTITATGAVSAKGQNLAGGNLTVTGSSIDLSGATTTGGNTNIVATNGDVTHTGANMQVGGALSITATGAVTNDKDANGIASQIMANKVTITASDISNKGSSIQQTGSDVTILTATNTIDNTGGSIETNGQAEFKAQTLDNTQGNIATQKNITIAAGTISNQKGTILSNEKLQLNIQNTLNNRQGLVQAQDTMAISAGSIDNQNGVIRQNGIDGGRVTATGSIDNTDGVIIARGPFTLIGDRIYNQGPKALIATTEQDLKLFAKISLENKDGAILYSAGNMQIAGSEKQVNGSYVDKTQFILNQSATMEAEKDMLLLATDISNRKRIFRTAVIQVADIAGPGICEGDRGHVHHSYYCDQHRGGPDTAILVTPPGQTPRGYLVRDVITETTIAEDSPEGKIIAGRNLTIRANTLTNNLSQVLAGATLDAAVGTLTNTSVAFTRTHNRTLGMELEPAHLDNLHLASDTVVEQLPSYASIFGGGKQVSIQAGTVANDNQGMTGNPAVDKPATQTNEPKLPQNSLYSVHKESTSKYLVETNPAFTDYKKFISSDYMLTLLGVDPEKTQKRLGDGFYEQKLVREQITELTGRRFLEGKTSDEEAYKDLLGKGVQYAKEFGLTVGVSLTAGQMDQLTTDIVWLVEKEVDGEKVLYPQVYLAKTRTGDIKPSGALITADTIQVKATNIQNSGELRAAGIIDLSGTTILNRGGTINANTLNITAEQDLQIQGGNLLATENANLTAGRNLIVDTLEQSDRTVNSINGSTYVREKTTNLTSTIKAGGNITLQAENDVTLRGAQVAAAKDLQVSAAGNVTVAAVKD